MHYKGEKMLLYIIYGIRYLFEAVFCYIIYKKADDNNSIHTIFKKENIMKMLSFCLISVTVLMLYRLVEIPLPISRLISAFAIFIYFWIESRKIRTWKYLLTFAVFISLVTESSHIIAYATNRYVMQLFGISDVMMNSNSLLFMPIVVMWHCCFMFLIYKVDLIKLEVLKILSRYKTIPIFFGLYLLVTLYLKHQAKQVPLENVWVLNVLSSAFLFLPLVLFILHKFSNTFTTTIGKLQEKIKEQKTNPAVEEAKQREGMRWSGMNFISEKFNLEMDYFKKELEKIGMDKDDHGSIQIAFAAVLLKQEENIEKTALKPNIYFYIGKILSIKSEDVEANINNALSKHWYLADSKTLKVIEANYKGEISKKSGAPTPKKFLIQLVKKCKLPHKTIS